MHQLKWESVIGDLEKYAIRNMHISCEPPYPMPQMINNSVPGIEPLGIDTLKRYREDDRYSKLNYYMNNRKVTNEMDGNLN